MVLQQDKFILKIHLNAKLESYNSLERVMIFSAALQFMILLKEFPVVVSLCLRKDFWDRHGANISTR